MKKAIEELVRSCKTSYEFKTVVNMLVRTYELTSGNDDIGADVKILDSIGEKLYYQENGGSPKEHTGGQASTFYCFGVHTYTRQYPHLACFCHGAVEVLYDVLYWDDEQALEKLLEYGLVPKSALFTVAV